MLRSIKFLLVSLFLILPCTLNAQEYYIRLFENDKEKINTVVTRTVSIDQFENGVVHAYANEAQLAKIKSLGYLVEILPHPSSHAKALTMATAIEQMANWDRYPTYEVYRAMMKKFEQDYPNLCKLDSIGTSVQGRKLYVVKISDNVLEDEAEHEFFYTGTMHGDETTGYVLLLRLIDYLLQNYGTDDRITSMVSDFAIYINPNANPDGTYWGGNHTVANARRSNANGKDLNRNFTDPRTGDPSSSNGPYQVETLAMMSYAESRNFVLSANFHGGIELVNFPWDTWTSSTNAHADHNWFYKISRQYADSAQDNSPSGYFTGQGNGVTHGGDWYVITGGRQDYMNYFHHCREVTLEISNKKLLDTENLPAFWNYNKEAMLTYIEHLYTGIQGFVTNVQGQPIDATIEILNHDKDNSHVVTNPNHGNYIRMIEPGTWQVSYSAQGYISQVHTITVADYSSLIEKDVVLLMSSQTLLSGTVSDAQTHDPINGALIELVGSDIDPVNTNAEGYYTFGEILENTYQIKVTKAGYYTQSITQTLMGDENIINFSLVPSSPESFEDGIPQGFTFTGGNWIIDESTAYHGSYSIRSAPITHNQNTTMEITLDVEVDGEILFARKVSSEQDFDFLKFYIDNNLRANWSGNRDWVEFSYPVSAGTRTFKWEYSKDGSVSHGSDCIWIDHIVIPMSIHDVVFTVNSLGYPLEGALVSFNGEEISTDVAGNATFSGVRRGLEKPYSVTKATYHDFQGTLDVQYVDFDEQVEMESLVSLYNLTFKVSDSEGTIEGASVDLDGAVQVTDSNGETVFVRIVEGTYPYAVEAGGYIGNSGSVLVDDNKLVEITLEVETFTVTFTILNDQESPIEGATVTFNGAEQLSDDLGIAEFTGVVAGNYSFTVEAHGYFSEEGSVHIDSDKQITINLEPEPVYFSLLFIILDNNDIPVQGASVTFKGQSKPTNIQGEAQFIEIFEGNYRYTIEADGFLPVENYILVNDTIDLTINLEPFVDPFTVTFTITDPQDQAIEGAIVNFNQEQLNTNSLGQAVFNDVPAGILSYSVDADSYYSKQSSLVVNENKQVAIVLSPLPPTYTVKFIVTDTNSNPIQGAVVNLEGNSQTVNLVGETSFNDMDEGIFDYMVSANGFYPFESTVEVNDNLEVPVLLNPSIFNVTFKVQDIQGDPIEGAVVTFDAIEFETNNEGIATFNGVEPSQYNYSAEAYGFYEYASNVAVEKDTLIIVTLNPVPPLYSVVYSVVDQQDIPLKGASVNMKQTEETTNEEGIAIFYDIIEGDYAYRVVVDGFITFIDSVTVNDDLEVHVTLETYVEVFEVTFLVSNDQEELISDATVTFNGVEIATNSSGEAIFTNIAVGWYEYTVVAEGFISQADSVFVDENKLIEVALQEEPPVFTVSFKVTNMQQVAIGGALINFNDESYDTDSNGTVTIYNVPAGTYYYSVEAENYFAVSDSVNVDADKNIQVVLEPEIILYTVTFFVNDLEGNPIEDAMINFDGDFSTSDSLGKAILANIEEGIYSYSVEADGFNVDSSELSVVSDTTLMVNLSPVNSSPFIDNSAMVNIWPNPFSQNLHLHIVNPVPTSLHIDVYSITGRKVTTIYSSKSYQDSHITWNGSSSNGHKLPEGIYLIRIKTDRQVISRRVILAP